MANPGKPVASGRSIRSLWCIRGDAAPPAQDPEAEILSGTGIYDNPHCGNHLPLTIIFLKGAVAVFDTDGFIETGNKPTRNRTG